MGTENGANTPKEDPGGTVANSWRLHPPTRINHPEYGERAPHVGATPPEHVAEGQSLTRDLARRVSLKRQPVGSLGYFENCKPPLQADDCALNVVLRIPATVNPQPLTRRPLTRVA